MKTRNPAWRIAQASAVFVYFLAQNAGAAQTYTFTDLGTLGGTNSSAAAINNAGQIVGRADIYNNAAFHATLWNETTATDLGTLGGTYSGATAINNVGQVAGYSNISGSSTTHATLWNHTAVTDLTPGGSGSAASAINDVGQVAGYTSANEYRATLWNGTTQTDLGTLGGRSSLAYGINSAGQVVGWSYTADNATGHAALWDATTMTDLGTQGGTYGAGNTYMSFATAINNAGQIAGYARTTYNENYHAAVWNGANFTVLVHEHINYDT